MTEPIKDPNAVNEKIKVVASALIQNQEGKYLAIELKDTDGRVIYIAPGGRLSLKETLRECVVREVMEEVGIKVEVTGVKALLEKLYEDGYWTFIFYSCEIIEGEIKNMEADEITNLKWIDLNQFDHYDEIKLLD